MLDAATAADADARCVHTLRVLKKRNDLDHESKGKHKEKHMNMKHHNNSLHFLILRVPAKWKTAVFMSYAHVYLYFEYNSQVYKFGVIADSSGNIK